mgnify:CR=1 FL=1
MDQYANVSICQPVYMHGATDWHIRRMGLFIVPFRFSHRWLLFCVKRVGYRRKSLYRSVRNATGSRIRICYRFSDSHLVCCRSSRIPSRFFPVSIHIRAYHIGFERRRKVVSCILPDVQILLRSSRCCNSV